MKKSLEQMARTIARRIAGPDEDWSALESACLTMGRAVIAVLEERCIDHACYAEGRIVDEHNPDESWGNTYSANDALELLQSLDKPDAKPTEGGE